MRKILAPSVFALALVAGLALSIASHTTAAPPLPVIDAGGNVRVASPIITSSGRIGVKNASATDPGVVTTTTQSFAGRKTFTGGVVIGSGGANFDAVYVATVVTDIASITAGSCATDVNVAMAGVSPTPPTPTCRVGFSSAPEAGLIADAFVSDVNTVTLRACANNGASAVDPASRTYTIRCMK